MRSVAAGALIALLAACTATGTTSDSESQPPQDSAPSSSPVGAPNELVCHTSPKPGGAGQLVLVDETETLDLIDPFIGMHVHAAAIADIDGDDNLDFYVGTFGDREGSVYMFRGASGPRPDQLLLGSGESGNPLGEELGRSSGSAIADFDADGDADLLVVRHAGLGEPSDVGSRLYENTGDDLVPTEILPEGFLGRTPAVSDFDGDGLLDVYVSEDKYGATGGLLLQNRGDMAFEDVTDGSGLSGLYALGATPGDLNGDGLADLVTSRNILINLGGMKFRDVTPDRYEDATMGPEDDPAGVAIGDLNRDGLPDIVLGQHNRLTVEADETEAIRVLVASAPDIDGIPTFVELAQEAGLSPLPTLAPHVDIADMNNDGWPDIVTSASAGDGEVPAVFMNEGAGDLRFAPPAGLGSDQYWVGGPIADIDRDGLLDVFALEWEPSLPSLAFINRSTSGHWLEVSISGPNQGIGAVVTVIDAAGSLVGIQEIGVTAGYSSAKPPVAHFGLGDVDAVDVTIDFPNEESVTIEGAAIDSHLRWPDGCTG